MWLGGWEKNFLVFRLTLSNKIYVVIKQLGEYPISQDYTLPPNLKKLNLEFSIKVTIKYNTKNTYLPRIFFFYNCEIIRVSNGFFLEANLQLEIQFFI